MVTLLCTVRGCMQPLERHGRTYQCSKRHNFDVARSGYINLLQPQDRRSAKPGDRSEAVLARRRLFDRGYGTNMTDHLDAVCQEIGVGLTSAILDIGCGEGTYLGRLADRHPFEAHGIDLAVDAIDLAAKRYDGATWLVANADRFLPYDNDSFDLVLSITSRRHPIEMRRVLKPGGTLVVAIPAPDDLVELRTAIMAAPESISRTDAVAKELASSFDLKETRGVREQHVMDRETLLDVLAATYRGARKSQQEAVQKLRKLKCTFSYDVMRFTAK